MVLDLRLKINIKGCREAALNIYIAFLQFLKPVIRRDMIRYMACRAGCGCKTR